jgi:hypothetical protein
MAYGVWRMAYGVWRDLPVCYCFFAHCEILPVSGRGCQVLFVQKSLTQRRKGRRVVIR